MNNSQSRSARYRQRRRSLSANRRLASTRRLTTESLENRILLAGDTSLAWHNAYMPLDASGNGAITPADVLTVIKDLNDLGARKLEASTGAMGMVDVNGDGYASPSDSLNIIRYLNAANGEGDEKVRFRLDVTSRDSEASLSSLTPNQDFFLRVYTMDLTDNPEGVFSAYLDVEYDADLADADGTIVYSSDFDDGKSGDVSVDGLLDEIGAFNRNQPADGSLEQLVLSVPMRTDSNTGTLTFTGNPPDVLPIHEILVQGDLTTILDEELLFEGVSIPIIIDGAPTGVADSYEAIEDITLNVSAADGVLSNDVPSVGLTATLVTGPTNGSLTLNTDGSFSYTPDPEYSGLDSFVYRASDNTNNSNDVTVTLDVRLVNDTPIAVDDSYTTDRETVLDRTAPGTGVLANDSDVDSPTFTVVTNLIVGPSNGQLSMSADGGFTYTPDAAFVGTDSFTYVITDGLTVSEPATVSIEVTDFDPDAPVANPDSYSTDPGQTLTVAEADGVLSNDTDPNGATLITSLITQPTNGTLTLNRDGSFVYIPDAGFEGTDSFRYVAMNVALVSPVTTVTIAVTDMNANPVANDDNYTVFEDETLTIDAVSGVLANDTDSDGDVLTAAIVTQPSNGTVTLAADGSFEYTPTANFNGSDSFTYRASDSSLSATATVTIGVAAVDDPPTVVDDSYDIDFETSRTVAAIDGVLSNDVDNDGDTLTAQLVEGPSNGTLVFNADGSFEYTPNAEFLGTDSFTYTASDGEEAVQGTVNLNVRPSGTLVSIRLEATDLTGNVITEINAGQDFLLSMFVTDTSPEPVEGVFAAYADIEWEASRAFVVGDITYDPFYFNGQKGNTSTPGLVDEAGAFTGREQGSSEEALLLTVPMQATGSGLVTFSTNPADVLPFGNILLFDTLDVAVPVEQVSYGSTTLTVIGPTAPVAIPDEYNADDGTITRTAANGVLANDADFSGMPLTATLVATTGSGTLDFNEDGSFTYTADAGFVGEDTFSYRITENGVTSNVTTVTIIVGDPEPGSIAGSVYFDTNNNGIRDAEHGFGGVTVTLTGTDIFGNDVAQETVTSRTGNYSFVNLSAGNYTVSQAKPEIVIDGKDTIGGEISATNDRFVIDLGAGTDLTDVNFGERGLMPQYIRNTLFMSSRITEGASVAIGPDGQTSWYCSDTSWAGLRDMQATLSADGTTVTIRATNNVQQVVSGTFTTANANVRVLGNATDGYLVRLLGSADSFPMTVGEVLSASAVDEAMAG